ncbi:hypothetical protein [Ralstonia mojiangensis]|uniref:hypothetical protein n=1 Tax=Ralstonia mojiangensis TaxID=2953895 RepID=UPI002090DE98|nr:hypothetical protein [Ralstonia mojiangensis]MCO5412871.1 hypothetical protein [Ralstonia mojiangensis]
MRTRPRLSATAKGVLIYAVAVVFVIVVHSLALYFDRAAAAEQPVRPIAQRQA